MRLYSCDGHVEGLEDVHRLATAKALPLPKRIPSVPLKRSGREELGAGDTTVSRRFEMVIERAETLGEVGGNLHSTGPGPSPGNQNRLSDVRNAQGNALWRCAIAFIPGARDDYDCSCATGCP